MLLMLLCVCVSVCVARVCVSACSCLRASRGSPGAAPARSTPMVRAELMLARCVLLRQTRRAACPGVPCHTQCGDVQLHVLGEDPWGQARIAEGASWEGYGVSSRRITRGSGASTHTALQVEVA
jgi:hypothetical protein